MQDILTLCRFLIAKAASIAAMHAISDHFRHSEPENASTIFQIVGVRVADTVRTNPLDQRIPVPPDKAPSGHERVSGRIMVWTMIGVALAAWVIAGANRSLIFP